MATSCGDPHHTMGNMFSGPRGLPFGLQHMRPGVGLHTMQVSQSFDTDIEDLDKRPSYPDVQGSHGPELQAQHSWDVC